MGNVCGSHAVHDGGSPDATAVVQPLDNASGVTRGKGKGGSLEHDAPAHVGSSQALKAGAPGAISIKVAPAPPPDEFPEIRAAVADAQKEVKAGARLKPEALYNMGQVIGTGASARVQIATCVKDGKRYAMKVLTKADGKEAMLLQLQNIVKEVAIMRLLADHPNTVQLHQVLQDAQNFYLVMELCNGGEIFDQICRSGHMTEQMAAAMAEQLISFLAHAHKKHVIHRDIKPENLLLAEGPDGQLVLKVVDYGCSTFCVPGKRLCKRFGTAYYIAPEVLWRDYDTQADVWSAGVVLYILLCGRPPFKGSSDEAIVSRVRTGSYRMIPDDWRHVSLVAQELVKSMLKLDATARPTAAELLSHPWFKEAAAGKTDAGDRGAELEGAAPTSMVHMVARLEAFAGMSRMKRLALAVLCHTVTDKHLMRLKEAFASLDQDGDGHLTPQELTAALRSTGALAKAGLAAEIDTEALEGLIAASDLYGEGYVDMDEFLAAMVANSNYSKTKDALRRSFDALDHDHDGFITSGDLLNLQAQLCGQHQMTKELADDMLSEVSDCISERHDGKMDFGEFYAMMTDANSKQGYKGKRVSADLARAEQQQQQQQQQQEQQRRRRQQHNEAVPGGQCLPEQQQQQQQEQQQPAVQAVQAVAA